jgi:protein-S-isoprenylcysteine O-methyltransferase Ste14
MAEGMKQQYYFFDVIFFFGAAAAVCWYEPWGPRFYAGMALMAVSFVLWMAARIQLGASFSLGAKARKLITTGLYSKFRNPIYLFGQLAYLGLAIAWGKPLGFVIVICMTPLQMLRAKKEQAILEQAFGDEYRAYKARTIF